MASKKARNKNQSDLFEYFHVDPDAWPHEPEIDQVVRDVINPRRDLVSWRGRGCQEEPKRRAPGLLRLCES